MSMSKEELMALAQKFDSRKGRRPRAAAAPTPALASKSDIEAAARLYDERLARASAYARARRRNGKGQSTMWELSQAHQQTPQQMSAGMNAEQMQAAINAAEQASANAQQDVINAQQDVISTQQEVQAAINAQHPTMSAEQVHQHDAQADQELNAEGEAQEASEHVVESVHQDVPEAQADQVAEPEVAEEAAQDNGREVAEEAVTDSVPETATDDVSAPAPEVQESVPNEAEISMTLGVPEAPEPAPQPAIPAEVAEKVEQVLTSTLNYTPRIAATYYGTTIARPASFKRSTPAASDQSPKKAKTVD